MAEIKLNNGMIAIIDDDDFESISKNKWFYAEGRHTGYAVRNVKRKSGLPRLMHRCIIAAEKGQAIDHINRNGLDNRKQNLRVCNTAQNTSNSKMRSTNSTGYRGVCVCKKSGNFYARIHVGRAKINLGTFKTKREAAEAYNQAAIHHHGEFASLNIITDGDGIL
jgi:hypothetical protein